MFNFVQTYQSLIKGADRLSVDALADAVAYATGARRHGSGLPRLDEGMPKQTEHTQEDYIVTTIE